MWTVFRWDEKRLILQVCVGAWMCCFVVQLGILKGQGERQVLHTLEYLEIKNQNLSGLLVTDSMWKQILLLFFFKLLFELLRSA